MKRAILFSIFLFIGFTASAQQTVNDSLKEEKLFKLLVQLKGKLLKEIDLVTHTDNPDSMTYHFKCIKELSSAGMLALRYPDTYTHILEEALQEPSVNNSLYYQSQKSRIGEIPGTLNISLREIAAVIYKRR